MDKQSLKKHHFWLLLALCVILIPIVLGGAVFSVGSAATDAKGKIDKKIGELQKAAPKSAEYLENLNKQKEQLEKQRNEVWKEVYDVQAGLVRWPPQLVRLDRLYFGDKLTEDDRGVFRGDGVYLAEYLQMPAVIEPTQFLDKEWSKVLKFVPEFKTLPTSEDCWLAVENICVQREVLRDIHNVNDLLARFLPLPQPIDKNAKPEDRAKYDAEKARIDKEVRDGLKVKDGEAFGRFLSPYWQLDLAAARSATGKAGELIFRGKMTNVSDRRQVIGRVDFRVWLADRDREPNAPPAVVTVQADALAANESHAFEDVKVTAAARTLKLFAVEQKLDLRFAPVKRVDRLELGYLSHRYAGQTLLAPNGPAFEESKAALAAAAANQGADPTGVPTSPGGRMGDGPGAGRGGGASGNVTSNGLNLDRYLHRTEQVRRMPIAVVLVVDQSHLQDVERAFANSRLRFQNVQFHWQRFRGSIDLNDTTPSSGASMATEPTSPGPVTTGAAGGRGRVEGMPIGPRPGLIGPGGPGLSGQGPGSRFPSGPPPGLPNIRIGPNPGGQSSTGTSEEQTSTLIEVTVYGIASLYERFPPKPPADATANAPTGVPPTTAAPASGVPQAPASPTPAGVPTPTAPVGNAPPAPPPPPVPPAPPPSPPPG